MSEDSRSLRIWIDREVRARILLRESSLRPGIVFD